MTDEDFEPVLTDLAKQALARPYVIAGQLGVTPAGPEMILLALAEIPGGAAHTLLERSGVQPDYLRQLIKNTANTQSKPDSFIDSLHAILDIVKRKGVAEIGTGDLLYALVLWLEREDPSNSALAFLHQKRLFAERIETYAHSVPEKITGEMRSPNKRTITVNGVRMRLKKETRWSRIYSDDANTMSREFSRFADGSASIALDELEREWSSWNSREKRDFSANVISLENRDQLLPILRFLMGNASESELSSCAISIATNIPPAEAVPFLVRACLSCRPGGDNANFCQALASTGAPEAISTIRTCLDRAVNHPDFLSTEGWNNWVAFNAVCCLKDLVRCSVPLSELKDIHERLKNHPHPHVRHTTADYLS